MYHIIVNPASRSGRGGKLWSELEPVFEERQAEYKVYFSKRAGFVTKHVRELSKAWNGSGSTETLKIIILGGDGTVNETLQGIDDFEKVEIGYIPTGSSNDLARDLQLPKEPLEILETILSDNPRRLMDIGVVSFTDGRPARRFAVSGGIGFDAAVCAEVFTSKLKNAFNKVGMGKLVYLAIALKQILAAQKVAANIYLDDSTEAIHLKKFRFVAGMVHKFEGGGFKFAPNADYTDGLLDVCLVGDISTPRILSALPSAFKGKHFKFKGIDEYRCHSLRVEVSDPLWVHTDGEVEQPAKKVEMICLANKLRLLC
jgi:YegS/Rv2252/BmrU family lipid kinase